MRLGMCLQPWRPPCRIRTIACGGLLHKEVVHHQKQGKTTASARVDVGAFQHVLKRGFSSVTCMHAIPDGDCVPPCRTLAAHTVAGALQLVRFGATLATGPALAAHIIDACAALARAHVQLPASDPSMLCQVCCWILQKHLLMSNMLKRRMHVQALNKAHADCAPVSEHHFDVSVRCSADCRLMMICCTAWSTCRLL